MGQSSKPRCSSRYSERNVMTFARSPVIPNTTSTSARDVRVESVDGRGAAACWITIGPPIGTEKWYGNGRRAPHNRTSGRLLTPLGGRGRDPGKHQWGP